MLIDLEKQFQYFQRWLISSTRYNQQIDSVFPKLNDTYNLIMKIYIKIYKHFKSSNIKSIWAWPTICLFLFSYLRCANFLLWLLVLNIEM